MMPKPTEWWLRPVMSAARVGEHSAVELNCVYRNPALATRSIAGVGMTPPNVPETPYPWSSVMISRMLGAPLGGTTCGGQYGLDLLASRLMTPPNFDGGGGRYFPSMVVVALGEPATPVVCCAIAGTNASAAKVTAESTSAVVFTVQFSEITVRQVQTAERLAVSPRRKTAADNAQARTCCAISARSVCAQAGIARYANSADAATV